jgi:hypothetical protein
MSRLLMVSSNASLQPDYPNDKFRVSYGFKALVSGCKNLVNTLGNGDKDESNSNA